MSPYIELEESSHRISLELSDQDAQYPQSLSDQESPHGCSRRPEFFRASGEDEVLDLICIGFGPASLAIAVALKDRWETVRERKRREPRVRFIERQPQFAWHAGMLLPGSKMQISFIKDLATLRDPRSQFTFMNYLKQHDRLVQFSNLGTFLPSRAEFEDYMRWCAHHFTDLVEYGQEALNISAGQIGERGDRIDCFTVECRNVQQGTVSIQTARHVVVAIGGSPHIPAALPADEPRIIHSSQYCSRLPAVLPDTGKPYRVAVVGSGQSAAEIFHDLHQRYPRAKTSLIIRDTALRPSDDSPFVNEIFDPDRVDDFYNGADDARDDALRADRSTNYSVVRLELLEQIYHDLYQQRIKQADETKWQHRILRSRAVIGFSSSSGGGGDSNGQKRPCLTIKDMSPLGSSAEPKQEETLPVDAVLLATGYVRNGHLSLLKPLEHLRPPSCSQPPTITTTTSSTSSKPHWTVGRDYKVAMDESRLSPNAAIWLQGCNETTHGLSDTLLSTLATRGGEMVDSIFGKS